VSIGQTLTLPNVVALRQKVRYIRCEKLAFSGWAVCGGKELYIWLYDALIWSTETRTKW